MAVTFITYPAFSEDTYFTASSPVASISSYGDAGEIIQEITLTAKINCNETVSRFTVVLYQDVPYGWKAVSSSAEGTRRFRPSNSAEQIEFYYTSGTVDSSFIMDYKERITNVEGNRIIYSWVENKTVTKGNGQVITITSPALNMAVSDFIGTTLNRFGILLIAENDTPYNRITNRRSPTFELVGGEQFTISATSYIPSVPIGETTVIATAVNRSGTTITSEPIAKTHGLKVSWVYNKSDADSFIINILLVGIDEPIATISNITGNSYTYFSNNLTAGSYYVDVCPVNSIGRGNSGVSESITFYSYSIDSVPTVIYKDLNSNIISGTTTESTLITASWSGVTIIRNDGETTNYIPYYQLNSSSSSSSYQTINYVTNTLDINSSITYNTLYVYLRDSSNTFYQLGYRSLGKTITVIAGTEMYTPAITKVYTTNNNLYSAIVEVTVSGDRATKAIIQAYYSGGSQQYTSSSYVSSTNGRTFTFSINDLSNVIVTEIRYSFMDSSGSQIVYNYNGNSGTGITISTSLSFPASWGMGIPSYLEQELASGILQDKLTITMPTGDSPKGKPHTIKFTLVQGGKSIDYYNNIFNSEETITLSRGDSIFTNFTTNSNIDLNYTITNVDTRYILSSGNPSQITGKLCTFQIIPATTFSASFTDSSNLNVYNLIYWNKNGAFSANSRMITCVLNRPEGVPSGGEESYVIKSVTNGLTYNGLTLTTQSSTITGKATVLIQGTYIYGETTYMDSTQTLTINIVDERPPFVNFGISVVNSYNNYYIPNYSKFTINNLNSILLKSGNSIKTINFQLCLDEAEIGSPTPTITGIPSNNEYEYPNAYMPLDIFYVQDNSSKVIGIKATVSDNEGRISSAIISAGVNPSYIPQPIISNADISNTESSPSHAKLVYTLEISGNSTLANNNNLKIKSTTILHDSVVGKEYPVINEIDYPLESKISMETNFTDILLPATGYAQITLQILYNDIAILNAITKKIGVAGEVGEIAIRQKKVGILIEPVGEAVFSIGSTGVKHFICFFGVDGQESGSISYDSENNNVLFSAGEWK